MKKCIYLSQLVRNDSIDIFIIHINQIQLFAEKQIQ